MRSILACVVAAVMLALQITVLAPAHAEDAVQLQVITDTGPVDLSFDQLKALPTSTIVTSTPWTDGKQTFIGVSGPALVAAMQKQGLKPGAASVVAVANNDYSIVVPFDVFTQSTTLIAFERNGQKMPVSDKGPLWIVFPYDNDSKFLTSSYKAYSIWGLERLEFQPE
jgi:hypothetical protein